MAVYDGPFLYKEDRSLAHNGEVPHFQEYALQCSVMISGSNDLSSFGIYRKKVGDNTVGNWNVHFWEKYKNDCYAFGLWCADGYHRSSSIGITNVDARLVERFREFLLKDFSESRLRLRIYHPHGMQPDKNLFRHLSTNIVSYPMRKSAQIAMQLYVNSRPLLRLMQQSRKNVIQMRDRDQIEAYFAGRFDGDGSVNTDGKTYCRVAYSGEQEAKVDQQLLAKIGYENTSVYHYRRAREHILYISKNIAQSFVGAISRYSITTPEMHVPVPVETFPPFLRKEREDGRSAG